MSSDSDRVRGRSDLTATCSSASISLTFNRRCCRNTKEDRSCVRRLTDHLGRRVMLLAAHGEARATEIAKRMGITIPTGSVFKARRNVYAEFDRRPVFYRGC